MGRSASERPVSGAGQRTAADDKSAARWFDWQANGGQNARPRTADVSRTSGGRKQRAAMQAAAALAATEAQANAARNGLPYKAATSPRKSGLHPTLLSNDQTDYKRRHGLNLQTAKFSRQWSHSGHFPGMPLSCWAQGCSKLWGCGHGVGDEELDRQLDLPEWEGRGNDLSVPEWLRYEGKIINRKLSKRFVLGFCHQVWDYKYPPPLIIEIGGVPTPVKREPRHGGLSLAFHECMKTTYGPPKLVAGVAYNMYYGLLRYRKEHADIDIFCRILTDELPSPALFAYMEEIESLRGLLRAADADKKDKLTRNQIVEVLKQRFGAKFDDARERAARAALDAEQPPLSVHPSWYLDPQNSRKAARINDVEYEKLIGSDRSVDHGPFAQLAKTLIIEELRAREWPAGRGDITRRAKYGDFLAWRKVRAGAAAAGVVGYLNRAVQPHENAEAQDEESDRRITPRGVGSGIGEGKSGGSGEKPTPLEEQIVWGGRERGGSGRDTAPQLIATGFNNQQNSGQLAGTPKEWDVAGGAESPDADQNYPPPGRNSAARANGSFVPTRDAAPQRKLAGRFDSHDPDREAAPQEGEPVVGVIESRGLGRDAAPPKRNFSGSEGADLRSNGQSLGPSERLVFVDSVSTAPVSDERARGLTLLDEGSSKSVRIGKDIGRDAKQSTAEKQERSGGANASNGNFYGSGTVDVSGNGSIGFRQTGPQKRREDPGFVGSEAGDVPEEILQDVRADSTDSKMLDERSDRGEQKGAMTDRTGGMISRSPAGRQI